MMEIVYGLFNYIEINLNDVNYKNQIEEIVENLYILLNNLLVSIKEDNQLFDNLKKRIIYFTELKVSEYEALSNKILFKFIDILEEFEDE